MISIWRHYFCVFVFVGLYGSDEVGGNNRRKQNELKCIVVVIMLLPIQSKNDVRCRRMQERAEGERTIRISPFGRAMGRRRHPAPPIVLGVHRGERPGGPGSGPGLPVGRRRCE
jgi:hypothetical protein